MEVAVQSCPLCGSGQSEPRLQILARRMVRCQQCGLIYRNPRPTAKDLTLAYAVSPTALVREERVGARRSRQFRRFLDGWAGQPGRLLDIGCGYGFFLKLAQEAGWEALGVDLDPRAVAYAKDHLQVNALWGELRNFRFEDGSFDLVTLWNVIECVPDPLALLLEVRRVLKPDGRIFIRTQNAVWHVVGFRLTGLLRRLGFGAIFDRRPYLLFVVNQVSFSQVTLKLLLEKAGFALFRIRNSPPIPGDPYVGLGLLGEAVVNLAKQGLHGLTQGMALVSGGRLLFGPSLEAYAQPKVELGWKGMEK